MAKRRLHNPDDILGFMIAGLGLFAMWALAKRGELPSQIQRPLHNIDPGMPLGPATSPGSSSCPSSEYTKVGNTCIKTAGKSGCNDPYILRNGECVLKGGSAGYSSGQFKDISAGADKSGNTIYPFMLYSHMGPAEIVGMGVAFHAIIQIKPLPFLPALYTGTMPTASFQTWLEVTHNEDYDWVYYRLDLTPQHTDWMTPISDIVAGSQGCLGFDIHSIIWRGQTQVADAWSKHAYSDCV